MSDSRRHRANRLLAGMRPDDFDAIAPHLESVELTPRGVLVEPGASLDHAYFPHSGAIGLVAALQRRSTQTATIGPEGFLGFAALLGEATATQRAQVQIAGAASRMKLQILRGAVATRPAMARLLRGYVRGFLVQALQAVACTRSHTVHERCAFSLLMAHDRAGAESFSMTQELLAETLGIHRPSVTIVARALQKAEIIRYSRGTITVVDRPALEATSCQCYRVVRTALDEPLRRQARVGAG